MDQNGPNSSNGTPYRFLSATSLGNNVCTGDYDDSNTLLDKAKGLYGNNNQKISNQVECKPNTLNAGNYYSFPAATAGSDTHTEYYAPTFNSICPKGWQLPPYSGNKSYNTLIRTAYDISSTTSGADILLAPLLFVLLGYYNSVSGGLTNRSGVGDYWTSTTYDSTRSHILVLNYGVLNPQIANPKTNGFSLRCVSR